VNEKIKNFGIAFIIGILIGTVGAGICLYISGSGRTGLLSWLATANARRAEDTVAELRGTINRQQERINELESDNQRLEEYLSGAGRICESLTGTVEASGTYTTSAVAVSKKIRLGIEALESWYNNFRCEYPWITNMEYGTKINK